jgi:non-ribosomal peptide synthetase component F
MFQDVFDEQTEKSPDAIAVICADACLTYRQLFERSN